MLESWQEFPATLPAKLVEETPLLYRKGERQAMTGLEVAEERERDTLQQQKGNKCSAAADAKLEAQEEERREEQELLAANWVADTQLQFQLSQLSYPDANADEDQQLANPHQPEVALEEADAGPGLQH
jgi:hypothetical protein